MEQVAVGGMAQLLHGAAIGGKVYGGAGAIAGKVYEGAGTGAGTPVAVWEIAARGG